MTEDPVHWPALLQHAGDAELRLVRDRSDWEQAADLHAARFQPDDCLIDSLGQVFRPLPGDDPVTRLQARGDSLSLEAVLGLVKAHAAQAGSCCVARLYAPTIAAAVHMLQALESGPD